MSKPTLPPYPAYKPTAIPWLQQVPEHWEVLRTKWLFQYAKHINKDGSWKDVLSLTLRGVVNNNPDDPEGLVPKDYRTYQRFNRGDLVFKLIDLENIRTSRVGLVHQNGIMSAAYLRLIPKPGVNAAYFYQQYYSLYQRHIFNQLGAGVRSTLGQDDLLQILVAVPPPTEQHLIVRFLHALDTKVKRYIRAKHSLIARLQEQKQAIIQRAVTRGLDPNVKLKPSGVEWLGEVPEHWEVVKLKRLASVKGRIGFRGYTTSDLVEQGKGALALGASHITTAGGVNIAEPVFISWAKYHESPEIMVDRNDLIVVQRGSCGKVALVDVDLGPATINPSLVLLKRLKVEPKFLLNVLLGGYIQNMIASQTSSTAVPMLSQKQIENFNLILPPRSEQKEIVELLSRETAKVDQPLARAEQAISRMLEYHTRLIADVVTGAVDARAAAQALPADQMISGSDDQTMEEEPLNMAAEAEEEYGG